MLQGLRTVIYQVADMDAAKKWYAAAFGVAPYFDQPFYIGFNVEGFELGLQPAQGRPANAENVVAYWAVADIQTAYAKLLELGAVTHAAPRDVGDGIQVATVRDPFGNVLGLIVNPHFGR